MARLQHPTKSILETFHARCGLVETVIGVQIFYALTHGGKACEWSPNPRLIGIGSNGERFDCLDRNTWICLETDRFHTRAA